MTVHLSRRSVLRAALIAPIGVLAPRVAAAVEPPSSGCGRPGPVCTPEPHRTARGAKPVAIFIPDAEVDAPVEMTEIINGQMSTPSGPWVVGWYRESGRLTEADNMVMAGHLDYWSVGRAVFYHLGSLKEGDAITVLGEDNAEYHYTVEWVRKINTVDAGPEAIRQVVGKTAEERLTLITCGGDFDPTTGEYEERTVVRAKPAT